MSLNVPIEVFSYYLLLVVFICVASAYFSIFQALSLRHRGSDTTPATASEFIFLIKEEVRA